jgi:Aminotransferase class I and II
MSDWSHLFARRTHERGGAELTAILAGTPPGVLSMTGGFPNPETFPTDVLDEIAARLLRDDAQVALQYTPCEGIPSVREYLIDRQEQLQGRRPALAELIVTSGGMECIALACQSMVEPGDTIAVEAPTYLGALMAFGAAQAEVEGIPMDGDGLRVDALEERLAAGLRPKFLYVIPEFQNPTGRTLPLGRRQALVELCRRYGVLILEDVAYRELSFDGTALPSLCSLAPDVVVQAGTFSKSSSLACASAGPSVRRTSWPRWRRRSRTPTSARAGWASGWWRSTAAPGTSSATSRPRGRCTRRAGRRWSRRSGATCLRDARGASRRAASLCGCRCRPGSTRSRCGRPRRPRASRTCPGRRSTPAPAAATSCGSRSAR